MTQALFCPYRKTYAVEHGFNELMRYADQFGSIFGENILDSAEIQTAIDLLKQAAQQ